ncbi:MAG: prolipoprotein diacylglyceryl transferase [Polyangiales bacterium]
MQPILTQLFGQPLPAFFTMGALAAGVGIFLLVRGARRWGLNPDCLFDLGLYAIIFGIAGARLLHVLADGYLLDYIHLCTDPARVRWHITQAQCQHAEGIWDAASRSCSPSARDCFAWLAFWRGGLTYYGGVAAVLLFAVPYLRRHGQPLGKVADLIGITLPLSHALARTGCFLSGCCFGAISHGHGLRFPAFSPASEAHFRQGLLDSPAQASLPVHPTQLYEAAGLWLISACIILVLGPRKRRDGQLMLAYLGLYATLRFSLEFLRADARGLYLGLYTSQWLSLAILAAAGAVWWRWRAVQVEARTDAYETAGTSRPRV